MDELLSNLRKNSWPLIVQINNFYGYFDFVKNNLGLLTSIPQMQGHLGHNLGNHMSKAVRLFAIFCRESCYKSETLRQIQSIDTAIAWRTNIRPNLTIGGFLRRYYFAQFKDYTHCADLAYSMLDYASRQRTKGSKFTTPETQICGTMCRQLNISALTLLNLSAWFLEMALISLTRGTELWFLNAMRIKLVRHPISTKRKNTRTYLFSTRFTLSVITSLVLNQTIVATSHNLCLCYTSLQCSQRFTDHDLHTLTD